MKHEIIHEKYRYYRKKLYISVFFCVLCHITTIEILIYIEKMLYFLSDFIKI